jgi:hypothetical protein
MQFTVGFRLKGRADHIVTDAEDALVAALRVKSERPEAKETWSCRWPMSPFDPRDLPVGGPNVRFWG